MKKLLFLKITILGVLSVCYSQDRKSSAFFNLNAMTHDLHTCLLSGMNNSVKGSTSYSLRSDLIPYSTPSHGHRLYSLLLTLRYKTFAQPAMLELMRKPQFEDKQPLGAFWSYSVPKSNISIGLMPGLEKWQWACNVSYTHSF